MIYILFQKESYLLVAFAKKKKYFIFQFLICSLAFATFAVNRDKPENRLQLSFTLVLTSVAFKFVVNQSLPKISYLTYLVSIVITQSVGNLYTTRTLMKEGLQILTLQCISSYPIFSHFYWVKLSCQNAPNR